MDTYVAEFMRLSRFAPILVGASIHVPVRTEAPFKGVSNRSQLQDLLSNIQSNMSPRASIQGKETDDTLEAI